jgi:hypothetical protein
MLRFFVWCIVWRLPIEGMPSTWTQMRTMRRQMHYRWHADEEPPDYPESPRTEEPAIYMGTFDPDVGIIPPKNRENGK